MTLEFLSPLAVALTGALIATSPGPRRRVTVACALLAATGVVLCWASYILLNSTLGQRVPGVEGSVVAGAVSALVYVPFGIATLLAHPPTPGALACAAAAGVLSSVVPFLADLLALRRVPAQFFGIFMSVNPLPAAAVGAIVLGESLAAVNRLAIGLIVTANAVAVLVTPTGTDRPECVSSAG